MGTGEGIRATDSATVEKSEDLVGSFLVRVNLRATGSEQVKPVRPTNAQLEGAIEAGLLTALPEFTPHVRAEHLDT